MTYPGIAITRNIFNGLFDKYSSTEDILSRGREIKFTIAKCDRILYRLVCLHVRVSEAQ